VGNGVGVSVGIDASTGAAVSVGRRVSVGRVGEFVGIAGEEQEISKKRQDTESRSRVVEG